MKRSTSPQCRTRSQALRLSLGINTWIGLLLLAFSVTGSAPASSLRGGHVGRGFLWEPSRRGASARFG